jgi:glycosyltransferase involved in cell wall biosynthesis
MSTTMLHGEHRAARQQPAIAETVEGAPPNPPRVSVVLPAYNEQRAIGGDLDVIRATMLESGYPFEIIVVDDGSTDGTLDELTARPWVTVVRHGRNLGTGAARSTGIRHARGDIIVMSDADGTYPNYEIVALLREIEAGADMVVGARRAERGTWPWLRRPAKWFIRRLAEYLTSARIPDLNSGFRACRKSIAERFTPILPTSHSWVSTITIAFLSEGYDVRFVPIDYFPRVGRSSFHPVRDSMNYLSLVVRAVTYFRPLKVFMPLAVALVFTVALKYVRDVAVYRTLYMPGGVTVLILLSALQLAALGLLADLIVRRSRA